MDRSEFRLHRLCFRLTRYMYWRLRDDANDRGMTQSSLVYWLLRAAISETCTMDQAEYDAWITGRLAPELGDQYRKEVKKGLARMDRGGVPF